jgi:hypothetical protein
MPLGGQCPLSLIPGLGAVRQIAARACHLMNVCFLARRPSSGPSKSHPLRSTEAPAAASRVWAKPFRAAVMGTLWPEAIGPL